MRSVNRHFPPVIHRWSSQLSENSHNLPESLIRPAEVVDVPTSFGLPSKVFKHELLQVDH